MMTGGHDDRDCGEESEGMGQQIIKQPNGRYAMWSSVVDHFTIYDATLEELIEDAVAEARERITAEYHKTAALLERGGKPSHQFTMTFEEACETAEQAHGKGDKELTKVRKAAAKPVEPA